MVLRLPFYLFLCLFLLIFTSPAVAVLSGYEVQREASGDPDYTAGLEAFEDEDWQGVIDNMAKVIERRPWHDNAYSLMGFAYRKLGDYPRSLEHYQKALELNPHHRGALAYLGETYLEMGRLAQANEMLERLEVECKRIAVEPSGDSWKAGCEEWQELQAAIAAYPEQSAPKITAD
jgi:tetratricopeptide (TPR) repeat protein